jgi:hypothetical protein
MTTMLSLILALMLTMGGSPAVSVNPVNSIGPESGVSHDITGKPRLGEFLKIYPVETKPNAGNPQLVLNLSFQYKKSPLINLYQAFGMNPPNRTDPYGLFDQLHMMYYNDENYMKRLWHDNPPTWEDIDNLLTEVSKDTQYVVEGGANLVFTTVQWVLHQSNALLCSLRGDDYYSYDLVTYKIDINDPAGIVPTIDTRPSAEKAIGMGGLDTVTGLYYWGESGINLLDPNLNAEEIEANKKTFFGGIPGVAVFVYGGYKYYEYVRSYSTPNYVESTYPGVELAHKNTNTYIGPQCVYEIRINGSLYKYGKADMTNLSTTTGNPVRLQSQLNKLQRQFPGSRISGKVLYENPNISTSKIKIVETRYIQQYYDKYGTLPTGNQNHPVIIYKKGGN